MRTLAEGLHEAVRLIADTFRLWWRNLLPLLTWFLIGYAGFRFTIIVAIWLGAHNHRSLAIGIFSAGVLLQLAVIVGMIRTCASSLYRWRDAAAGPGETTDPTQQRLLELLSLTLLPLVAVWSAWGFLDEQISELATSYAIDRGLGPGEYLISFSGDSWKGFLPALVALLVIRRVLEAVDDRWPSKVGKLTQVWSEAFFLLLVLAITTPVINLVKSWIEGRVFWFQTVQWWGSVKEFFSGIKIPIPDGLEFLWGVFDETLWPLFKDGVAQPLTWLAITTVVFGHRALSSTGFVRGTRFEQRLGTGTVSAPQGRIAKVANQAPNMVLGGLKEKFYPTLNAFRLLVQVGPVFLGVVCLVYTIHYVGYSWAWYLPQRLIGPLDHPWTLMVGSLAELARGAIFDTLRIALLAAAFDQCLSVGAEKRQEARLAAEAEPEPEPELAKA